MAGITSAARQRRVVLVKWWLLAIPHLLIIGAFSTGSYGSAGDGRRSSAGRVVVGVDGSAASTTPVAVAFDETSRRGVRANCRQRLHPTARHVDDRRPRR
jgi:hypothetical protein